MYNVEVVFKDNENVVKHFKAEQITYAACGTTLLTGETSVYIPNHIIHHIVADTMEETHGT